MNAHRHHAPWQRRPSAAPRHPTGRTRRRWPHACDPSLGPQPRLNPRYRRAYDGDRRASDSRVRRRRAVAGLQCLRESPLRSGLVGLAVAGAAIPVAASRYQQVLRSDPAHERVLTRAGGASLSDDSVSQKWRTLRDASAAREQAIQRNLQRYAEFDLTRAMAEEIYDSAIAANVDPDVAFGLVRAESSFRNTATSVVGAVGLTQLMPKTAAWLEPGTSRAELRDPETNLRIGFKYLRRLLDQYDGDARLALTAYNRGPGTVDRELKRGGNPDNGYADFVYGKQDHGHRLFTGR